jgi:RHS repeat-associated protein
MPTALRTYYRGHTLAVVREQPVGGSPATRYYHFDTQGTTQCLTEATGAVTDRFNSDAWGVQVKRTGSSLNRNWYVGGSGYQRESHSDTYYIRARVYAARVARWVSRDPVQPWKEHYTYSKNAPTRWIDPTGLLCNGEIIDTGRCVGACGPPPCRQCNFGVMGCRAGDCPRVVCDPGDPIDQIVDLYTRLREVADAIGPACREGGQPIGGPGTVPWALTLCCPYPAGSSGGRGCDALTQCLSCDPAQRGVDWTKPGEVDRQSCKLACLLEHEKDHRRQCRDNAQREIQLYRECKPWQVECKCLINTIKDVLVLVAEAGRDKPVMDNCCSSRTPGQDCATALDNLKEALGRHFDGFN